MVFRLNLHHSALLFALLTPSATICAQQKLEKTVAQPAAPQPAAPAATAKPKRATAAEKAKIEQQKALGLSLLVSLANDARNFSDQKLRARTLSRVADSLWESDPEQGRALFRKAWDAAEAAAGTEPVTAPILPGPPPDGCGRGRFGRGRFRRS